MTEIKQAAEKDIFLIEEILLEAAEYLISIGEPMWEKQNVLWHKLSRYFKAEDFYIAYLNGMPAGCMALVDYDPVFWKDIERGKSLFIHKIAVKRFVAKTGVSTALINFAKRKAAELKINEIRLDCHQFRHKLRDFYEKEGFVCVAEKCLWYKYHTALYMWENKQVKNRKSKK